MDSSLTNQFLSTANNYIQTQLGGLGNPTLRAELASDGTIAVLRKQGNQPVKPNAFTEIAAYLRTQFPGYKFTTVNSPL